MYTIRLKNCAFFARHGLLDEEETLGQRFYVDAALQVEPGSALEDDRMDATVDYGEAFAVIERIITGKRRFLIEALAWELDRASKRIAKMRSHRGTGLEQRSVALLGVLDYVEVTVVWPG